jgi:hypothetical protein
MGAILSLAGNMVNTQAGLETAKAIAPYIANNITSQQGYQASALGDVMKQLGLVQNSGATQNAYQSQYAGDYGKAVNAAATGALPAGAATPAAASTSAAAPVPGASGRYGAATANGAATVKDYTNGLIKNLSGAQGTIANSQGQARGLQQTQSDLGVLQSQAQIANLGSQLAESQIGPSAFSKLLGGILSGAGGAVSNQAQKPPQQQSLYDQFGGGGNNAAGQPLYAGNEGYSGGTDTSGDV